MPLETGRPFITGMTTGLPFPTHLSSVLVAFTIEFDNEADHRMAHRTTSGSPAAASVDAPWLVSQFMWSNVIQYVSMGGIRIRELHGRARTTRDSLAGAPPRTCGDLLRVSLRSAGGHGSTWTTSTPFEPPCKQWSVNSTWSRPSISPSSIRPRMGRPTSRGAGSQPHPLPMWVECRLSICPNFSPRCFLPSPSTSSPCEDIAPGQHQHRAGAASGWSSRQGPSAPDRRIEGGQQHVRRLLGETRMCGSRARSGHQSGKAGATLSQGPRGSGQVPTHTGGHRRALGDALRGERHPHPP